MRRPLALALAAMAAAASACAAGLEPVARSRSLELLFDSGTTDVAVRDLRTGRLWRGTLDPGPGETSEARRRLLASPFQLSYLDRQGRVSLTADRFSEGVTAAVSRITAGVRVVYRIPCDLKGAGRTLRGVLGFAVEYSLEGDALQVRVPGADLREEGDLVLASLQVLPLLGANADREGGGLLVPDGSGAFMDYRVPSASLPVDVQLRLYGEERRVFDPRPAGTTAPTAAEVAAWLRRFGPRDAGAPLPAFAVLSRGGGMLGFVTAGAELCRVRAVLASDAEDANRVGVELLYRQPYLAFLSRTATVERYQTDLAGGDRTVRYIFSDTGDWRTLAFPCRGLLAGPPGAADPPAALVRVFCAVQTRRLFGEGLAVATTFRQAADIARAVRSQGIEGFALMLTGWESGGYNGKLPQIVPPERALGGERGIRDLVAACHAMGVAVFLEADWSLAVSGRRGARIGRDALRDFNRLPVTDGRGAWLLAPRVTAQRLAPSDLDAIRSWGVDGVAFRSIGRTLIGDEGGTPPGRSGSLDWTLELLREARARGLRVLTDGANAYVLGLAEGAYDVAGTSSGLLATDRDVPFLQLATSESAWLAGSPLNLAPDPVDAALAAAATGMVPVIELTAGDPAALRGSAYDHLVRSRADEVLADVGPLLARVARAGAARAGRPIAAWSEPAPGVVVVEFEGGAGTVVNRSGSPFAWGGATVGARDLAQLRAAGDR